MQDRNYRDMIGGGLLVLFGLWVAWQAWSTLDIGSARRMGPGFFPLCVGLILAGLGGIVLAGSFVQSAKMPEVDLRACVSVLASLAVFAFLLKTFGLLPAIAALVGIASLADRTTRARQVLALIAVLCVLCWLVFRLGLGMPLPVLKWPF